MDATSHEEAKYASVQVNLASATDDELARILNPTIRRLAEQVAQERREAEGDRAQAGQSAAESSRIFAKGF
jgi:hypothetical protein